MKDFAAEEVVAALPAVDQPVVEALIAQCRKRGAALYLVGGPVRDLLLERPLHDVDLIVEPGSATGRGSANAEGLARAVARGDLQVTVHERFGTVSISGGGVHVDLATTRRESYARPGALPSVEPGDLAEDLARRDFSINALALQLAGSGAGGEGERRRIVAPAGALRDLREKRLCILHPRSFHDDPTRALRAARLGPRLGFSLARSARGCLRDALRDGAFGGVSGDRYRREIERVFADATLGLNPADALRRMADWHVLSALEPGLELPREAVAPLRRFGRSLREPPWRLGRMRPWASGLCVWLAPLAPALRRRALARLSVRGELAKRVAAFPRSKRAWQTSLAKAHGRGRVDAILHDIDEEQLFALHACADAPLRKRIVRWAAEDRGRRTPLTGSDVTELGASGPAVGRILARVRAAYLDGALANREEALTLAGELLRRRGSSAASTRRARKRS